MNLQNILLENFRNHSSTIINCSQGINFLLGNNGEGKTNILEGISYLCLSRSFFYAADSVVTKVGESGFKATGKIVTAGGIGYEVQVNYKREENSKSIFINKSRIEKASLLIGKFPIVVLSPEHSTITFGSPTDRRRFVDLVVSQSSKVYLDNLIDYRRILKQRNIVLSKMQSSHSQNYEEIEPWNEGLVNVGSAIIKKRIEFVEEFKKIVVNSYVQLAGSNEEPRISYEPSFKLQSNEINLIKNDFENALLSQRSLELRIGHTLAGPHRDEFIFHINNLSTHNYASQGQHKTLLIALKLAEFYYLKERCNETPILLFDDVLSELDSLRSQRLLEIASEFGQIFITSTDERSIDWSPIASAVPRKFFIKHGSIERVEEAVHIH